MAICLLTVMMMMMMMNLPIVPRAKTRKLVVFEIMENFSQGQK